MLSTACARQYCNSWCCPRIPGALLLRARVICAATADLVGSSAAAASRIVPGLVVAMQCCYGKQALAHVDMLWHGAACCTLVCLALAWPSVLLHQSHGGAGAGARGGGGAYTDEREGEREGEGEPTRIYCVSCCAVLMLDAGCSGRTPPDILHSLLVVALRRSIVV
jgi:hypothetical protein